jgi:glucose/arabinose dehydrogenase
VYAIIDTNKDGIADSVVTVVDNLAAPLGLAYANGSLWVATTPTIYRFDNVDELALAGQVVSLPPYHCKGSSSIHVANFSVL